MPEPTVQAVSTLVSQAVPEGKAAQFECLLRDMIVAARGFAGHLGVDVLRPERGGIYQILYRYRSRAEHDAWMSSDQRRRLSARMDELLSDSGKAEVRSVQGWEGWFVTASYHPPAPPQRWKMAVVTFGALYPIALGLLTALRPLTHGWPLPLVMLLVMGMTIPFMTWVVMPRLTIRLGRWLRG